MGYALRQCRDSAVEAALLASTSAPVLGREFDDQARATIVEYDRLAAALSWPAKQQQDGAAPEMPPVIAMSMRHLLASLNVWRVQACRNSAERDALAARVAELEAEQPQDDGDVRAVAALAAADDDEQLDRSVSELIARFADRIAALEARDTADATSRGCDHGPEYQCVSCVGEGEFRFEPLGRERDTADGGGDRD
jgi:maltooligosyltrehalose synthase